MLTFPFQKTRPKIGQTRPGADFAVPAPLLVYSLCHSDFYNVVTRLLQVSGGYNLNCPTRIPSSVLTFPFQKTRQKIGQTRSGADFAVRTPLLVYSLCHSDFCNVVTRLFLCYYPALASIWRLQPQLSYQNPLKCAVFSLSEN